MSFDTLIDRRNTHSVKWDGMEKLYGVSPEDGIAMWVADMDFAPPACVAKAVSDMAEHGVYGYFGDDTAYRAAICWWMKTRHGWDVAPREIFSTNGLVNAVGVCVDAFTKPGDGVVLMTPVYHAFARVLKAAKRDIVECELALEDGKYRLDIDAWTAQMTGRERMLILCSPHNPGGRVWSKDELRQIADFAKSHDLIVISDEVHQDLVFEGNTHIPMPVACPDISDRLLMLTATSKTFNIAGSHIGNIIVQDADLRSKLAERMMALSISANAFGMHMATAAYSEEGAAWVDELVAYLDENRRIWDAAINAIPGLRSMPMEATYLTWVDFSATGMEPKEFTDRVTKTARIAANLGPTFGKGGENFLRFNIGAPRSVIEDAAARMTKAFADLQ